MRCLAENRLMDEIRNLSTRAVLRKPTSPRDPTAGTTWNPEAVLIKCVAGLGVSGWFRACGRAQLRSGQCSEHISLCHQQLEWKILREFSAQ